MTMFGLDEAAITPLVAAVTAKSAAGGAVAGDAPGPIAAPESNRSPGPTYSPEDVGDRFARATWTGIAEPGDRMAGVLVSALGASLALTAVIERWSAARVQEALAAAGAEDETDDELTQALGRWQPRLVSGPAVTALRQAARLGVRLAIPGDTGWPAGLADLGPHAPLALWVRGNGSTLAAAGSGVALVGARAATGYGEHVTMEASAGLVDRGFAIVSGAAYGIDGMAHRAALASSGQTMAILAGGVDRFYPSGHDALLTRIVECGVVISELPCGAAPTKWRFLQRNRLIAAISQATIVLEAGWRSGSLNTAGHAAALGRPLGAVPGPVTSAASAGCHRLIRDFGAICVTTPDEMAELMQFGPDASVAVDTKGDGEASEATTNRSADQTRVLDALSARSPRSVDEVARRAGLAVTRVQSVLGVLDLDRSAVRRERGWVKSGH